MKVKKLNKQKHSQGNFGCKPKWENACKERKNSPSKDKESSDEKTK